jgi:hypothetical protein
MVLKIFDRDIGAGKTAVAKTVIDETDYLLVIFGFFCGGVSLCCIFCLLRVAGE